MQNNFSVTVIDNLISGNINYISRYGNNCKFKFIEADILDIDAINEACKNIDFVYHLAANPDVRLGANNTRIHFDQNIIATYNLLEAMRKNHVNQIAFTSTSTIYGEAQIIPTPENYGPLVPISIYGASKLACEALISSYCHTFDMKSWIFRFANIIGDRSTHGIIFDFINKLKYNPYRLEILGNGKQSKSYLHVKECIDAIEFVISNTNSDVNIYNISSEDTITSTEIAQMVVDSMNLKNVLFDYTGGSRGWKGDVPKMMLNIDKLKKLGWKNKYGSYRSVNEAIKELLVIDSIKL